MEELNANLDPDLLLNVAAFRAGCCLGLAPADVETFLSVDRVHGARAPLDTGRQLLLIRLSRALDCLYCGDLGAEQSWFTQFDPELAAIPCDLIRSSDGLGRVTQCVERRVVDVAVTADF
ncbi:MAG: hypothetical protein ACFCUG_06445 [Thiotrichales bacterium]